MVDTVIDGAKAYCDEKGQQDVNGRSNPFLCLRQKVCAPSSIWSVMFDGQSDVEKREQQQQKTIARMRDQLKNCISSR